MWDISIWWQNQIVIYCLPSLQALFLQGMCAQVLTLPGVYLHRIINLIPFHRPCVNFPAVKSVWINNTPLHNTYINARSIYTRPVIKVAKKYVRGKIKNNGSEWNRKYDVFSWFWWLHYTHRKNTSKTQSPYWSKMAKGCLVTQLNLWGPWHALLHPWEVQQTPNMHFKTQTQHELCTARVLITIYNYIRGDFPAAHPWEAFMQALGRPCTS